VTPIHLHTKLLPPQTEVWKLDGFCTPREREIFEAALAVYLPDTEKCFLPQENKDTLAPEANGNLPELGIQKGITTQTIFVIEAASDNADMAKGRLASSSWAVEFMEADNFAALKKEIRAIYEATLRIASEPEKDTMAPCENYQPQRKEPYPVAILTMWETKTRKDPESETDEIQEWIFKGVGQTILAEEKEEWEMIAQANPDNGKNGGWRE
jgi:hypothetical protein